MPGRSDFSLATALEEKGECKHLLEFSETCHSYLLSVALEI